MVGERLLSAAAISGSELVLAVVIIVEASPTKILKNRLTVQRMGYNNSGNYDVYIYLTGS